MHVLLLLLCKLLLLSSQSLDQPRRGQFLCCWRRGVGEMLLVPGGNVMLGLLLMNLLLLLLLLHGLIGAMPCPRLCYESRRRRRARCTLRHSEGAG